MWFIVTIVVAAAALSGLVTAVVLHRRWHARMRTAPAVVEMVPTEALNSGAYLVKHPSLGWKCYLCDLHSAADSDVVTFEPREKTSLKSMGITAFLNKLSVPGTRHAMKILKDMKDHSSHQCDN